MTHIMWWMSCDIQEGIIFKTNILVPDDWLVDQWCEKSWPAAIDMTWFSQWNKVISWREYHAYSLQSASSLLCISFISQHTICHTDFELTWSHVGFHIREPHMERVWANKCHAEFVLVVIDKRLLAWLELSVGVAQSKPLPSVAPLAGGLDNDVA